MAPSTFNSMPEKAFHRRPHSAIFAIGSNREIESSILPDVYFTKPPSNVTNPSPGITLYADRLMDSNFHPLLLADETNASGACSTMFVPVTFFANDNSKFFQIKPTRFKNTSCDHSYQQ